MGKAIFAGDYDSLPEYEIKTRVKLPGNDLWDKRIIGDALDIVEKTVKLAAKTACVLIIATRGLPLDGEGLIHLTHLEMHMAEIEKVLRSAHECGCSITQKAILETWNDSPPEVKSEIKQAVLKALDGPRMTDKGKVKLREKFKEVLEYEL